MKLKNPPPPAAALFPPPPPTTLADFRAAWVAMMQTGQRLDAAAGALLQDDSVENHRAYKVVIHDGWQQVWSLIQLARGLTKEDRAVVEAKMGPLFTKDGALTEVWRSVWLRGPRFLAWQERRRSEVTT